MGIRALTLVCLWMLAGAGCGRGERMPDASLDRTASSATHSSREVTFSSHSQEPTLK